MSSRGLGGKAVDVSAMQEPDQYHYIALNGDAESVVTYPDPVVRLSGCDDPCHARNCSDVRSRFDGFDRSLDSAPYGGAAQTLQSRMKLGLVSVSIRLPQHLFGLFYAGGLFFQSLCYGSRQGNILSFYAVVCLVCVSGFPLEFHIVPPARK